MFNTPYTNNDLRETIQLPSFDLPLSFPWVEPMDGVEGVREGESPDGRYGVDVDGRGVCVRGVAGVGSAMFSGPVVSLPFASGSSLNLVGELGGGRFGV